MRLRNFNEKFVTEGRDKNGVINKFEINVPGNFNFAYDVIDEIAKTDPGKTAIIWCNEAGEEKYITYSELSKKSCQAANLLTAYGIKKGDKVMSVLKRHYQFWFLAMGLCKIGAVLIPATNQLQKKDYLYRFGAAEVSYLVATGEGDVTVSAGEAIEEYKGIKEKFIVRGSCDGWVDFDGEIEKYPDTFERIETDSSEDMLLYFTSGTTGYPKMVVHSYKYGIAHLFTAKHWHNLNDESIHLTISETGWAKSMWGKMYGQFLCGAAVFVFDFNRFKAEDILAKIEQYKITSLCAPPTMFRLLMLADLSKYDLSSLKYSTIAGEALSPDVYNNWYKQTGIKLMEGFGQTETIIIACNVPGMEPKPGSMGKAVPVYDVDIVDSEGKSLPAGETGEIVLRTGDASRDMFGMFKGYYKNEEATSSVWNKGIYHTGDTAWRDEDGYIWYVGRNDDLIKASGYRIGPFEIESVLLEHPAVLEAAVTGVKDPVRGQVVKATIVLRSEYKDKGDEKLVKELQEHVKNTTAPYKYPRIVEFVSELPKTISGKIRRAEIREKSEEIRSQE